MTANKLADKLDEIYTGTDYEDINLAATMLRQQDKKIEDLLEHNVKLIDDLFAERKEVIKLEAEIEALKKELALQKLSDISQEIEDRDSAIYATGYWKGIEKAKEKNVTLDTRSYLIGRYDGLEIDELKQLVKSFFEDYLNYEEESDSGRVFNPIHLSCTRAMMIEPLAKLLMRMKELSGVKE